MISIPRLAILVSAWIAIALGAAQAQAQAPQAKLSERMRLLLDTSRVRVTELVVKPGGTFDLPKSGDQFAYLLTDATLVFQRPGRTAYELTFKAGEATLLPTQTTDAKNGGDREVRVVLVEIKGTAPRKPQVRSRKGRKTLRIDTRRSKKK